MTGRWGDGVYDLAVATRLDPDEEFDYVFVTAKSVDTAAVCREFAPVLARAEVVSLQNGIGNEEIIAEYRGPGDRRHDHHRVRVAGRERGPRLGRGRADETRPVSRRDGPGRRGARRPGPEGRDPGRGDGLDPDRDLGQDHVQLRPQSARRAHERPVRPPRRAARLGDHRGDRDRGLRGRATPRGSRSPGRTRRPTSRSSPRRSCRARPATTPRCSRTSRAAGGPRSTSSTARSPRSAPGTGFPAPVNACIADLVRFRESLAGG